MVRAARVRGRSAPGERAREEGVVVPEHPRSKSGYVAMTTLDQRAATGSHRAFGPGEAAPAEAHAKIHRIVEYWHSLVPGPGLLPGRQHIDPIAIPSLLSNIWLLDIAPDDPRRYRFRLIGGALREAGVTAVKGSFLADTATPEEASRSASLFERLETTRTFDWRRGAPALGFLEHVSELERVFLPMARDGRTVDLLLCLTVFYYADGTIH